MTKQFALDLFDGRPPRAGTQPTTKIMRQPCLHCSAEKVVVLAVRPDDTAMTFCSIDHAKIWGWPWLSPPTLQQ